MITTVLSIAVAVATLFSVVETMDVDVNVEIVVTKLVVVTATVETLDA